MAKRLKIALGYSYDENWIGGTYYIQNLVAACNHLTSDQKPDFVILADNKGLIKDLKRITNYRKIIDPDYFLKTVFVKIINKLSTIFLKKTFTIERYKNADILFPAGYESKIFRNQTYLYWIPDFQEHYLPEFFTEDEIKSRKDFQIGVLKKAKFIVFSSISAKKDFNEIYPDNSLKQFVMPFAVTHPDLAVDFKKISEKFQIAGQFFLCSNQFWKHKNHIVILKAVNLLKLNGINIVVVFTGKEYDRRSPGYFDHLKTIVESHGIQDNVRFLGFINRTEQLALMKNSVAIIQPSLFEGWSTVIEDGKSLNKAIIASDIDVHREQLSSYSSKHFFDPYNALSLSDVLLKQWTNQGSDAASNVYDYKKDILRFADSFINIINSVK